MQTRAHVEASGHAPVPVRVVVLDHTAALGGAELSLLRLLDVAPPDIVAHVLLFASGRLSDALSERHVTTTVLPLTRRINETDRHSAGASHLQMVTQAVAVLPHVLRVARTLRRLNPDIVYTTSLKADLIGGLAAVLAGKPLVWHIHDRISPDYLPGPLVALLRSLASHLPRRVIVNSQATADTLPGVAAVIAYPGFSRDQVGPRPGERTPPNPPAVGLIGRISPTKGQREFVRAAAIVHDTIPEARFRIIGSAMFDQAPYEREVRDECARLGMEEFIEFTGFVDDPAAQLDALTVCVHASPTPEPFGQVIVEAMIRGVPVVATSGGGVDEIVAPDDDLLGWLARPSDPDSLASAIIEALTQPEEARRRAELAWEAAIRRFPVEETARVVSEVWRSVARGR